MALPVVYARHELGGSLRLGHPWVYRNRLTQELHLPSGTWVQVQCGSFHAYGLWDAESPIAVRIFSWQRVPDAAWFAERVRLAWDLRAPIREGRTSAYRWVYGEGDGIPGVVVDLYNDYAVIELYASSLRTVLDWLVEGLTACRHLKGILLRGERVERLWGRVTPRDLIVEENGLRLRVDLYSGQKTGLYLDHRENRQYLEAWCTGRRVLNCFAYTGAFALYAIRGGAREVINVDLAAPCAGETRRNLELNGFEPEAHPFVIGDCFDLLDQYAAEGQRFDLVILDPPSLARSRKSLHAALRAYVRLNQAALRCLPAGGLLAAASCTSQVSADAFRGVLADAAHQAGRRLLVIHEAGHALDHPVPAQFPEGRYLKFVLAKVGDVA
jgi:23S rRNA (cytosine1962-C5)-methyltransferase